MTETGHLDKLRTPQVRTISFLSVLPWGHAATILWAYGVDHPATIANETLNPFSWADAAEAENSEAKLLEDEKRGANVPPILIRAATFYVSQDNYEKALPYLKADSGAFSGLQRDNF